MSIMELLFVYCLGAVGYGGIESLWRGYTHWTMMLLGGACFLLIYAVTAGLSRWRLWQRWLLCAACVTALEFASGCLLNLRLGWNVWDYTGIPGNLLGQVCPLYTALWYLLSIPCSLLSVAIRRWMFSERQGMGGQSGCESRPASAPAPPSSGKGGAGVGKGSSAASG